MRPYFHSALLAQFLGGRIISGSADNTLRVWPTFPTTIAIVAPGLKIALRYLTQKQRVGFSLNPEPPAWCYNLKKWPYHNGRDKPLVVQ